MGQYSTEEHLTAQRDSLSGKQRPKRWAKLGHQEPERPVREDTDDDDDDDE